MGILIQPHLQLNPLSSIRDLSSELRQLLGKNTDNVNNPELRPKPNAGRGLHMSFHLHLLTGHCRETGLSLFNVYFCICIERGSRNIVLLSLAVQ